MAFYSSLLSIGPDYFHAVISRSHFVYPHHNHSSVNVAPRAQKQKALNERRKADSLCDHISLAGTLNPGLWFAVGSTRAYLEEWNGR